MQTPIIDTKGSSLLAPPLSVYVHLPWCVRKCPYCDFNSHVCGSVLPEKAYADALLRDLDWCLEERALGVRSVGSIFFGGGTPSLFAPATVSRLVEGILGRLPVDDALEVTLEANPGAVEHGRFEGYRQAGVNRISLGVQSFDDASLQKLGRIHTARDALIAIDQIRRAGFDNFNLDLMYALPDQNRKRALADMEQALDCAPSHLSCYQLTLEPGTAFHRHPPTLPNEDQSLAMELALHEQLASKGYERYEISAFATPGRQCRHNLNYWCFGDYLGLGAGAHGKWSEPHENRIERSVRVNSPASYMKLAGSPQVERERRQVTGADRRFEFLLNALRMPAGFRWPLFEARTGHSASELRAAIQCWPDADELLLVTDQGLRATALGLRYLNVVLERFIPD